MKRRITSVFLVLMLILTALPAGLAEEYDAPVEYYEYSEYQDAVPVMEAPTEEPTPEPTEIPTEVPTEEPPAEQPSVDTNPTDAFPTEAPFVQETPIWDVTATPAPATPAPVVDGPEVPDFAVQPTDTPQPPEYVEREEITEESDLSTIMAVGSNGIQYAGVAYLSVAAFQSLDVGAQINYIQTANEVASMLEAGVQLTDVVFYLDEDGNLGFLCTYPMESLASEVDPSEVTAPIVETAEAVAAEPELVTTADAPAEEPEEPIVENVDLAEEVEVPIESIPVRAVAVAAAPAASASGTISQEYASGSANTTFWSQKNYFYNQLSANAKQYYDAIYKSIIVNGQTGFTVETTAAYNSTYVCDALSALINTYPNKFDWCDVAFGWQGSWSLSSGVYSIKITLAVSNYYSASLEQSAQTKVNSVINQAYTYAQQNYSGNITYGMVRYFDNWLCANNYYENAGTLSSYSSTSTYYYCHTSYGCLLKGYGVCESYARAMARLLDAAGIPNLYIVGTANGGGHAWNCVQMPDGKFYLQDSTWDDTTASSHNYSEFSWLLIGSSSDSGNHKPQGKRFATGSTFSYPNINSSTYVVKTVKATATPTATPKATATPKVTASPTPAAKALATPTPKATATPAIAYTLSKSTVYLTPSGTTTLTLNDNGYYKSATKTWSSSNTSVAKVDKNGKVTAVAPGEATITLTVSDSSGSKAMKCTAYVYKVGGLTFKDNSKTTLTKTQTANPFHAESVNLSLSVQGTRTAQQLFEAGVGKAPTVTSSNKSVATATATLSGNTLTLNITPAAPGDTKIKVTFGGKTATLTYKVRKQILDSWFSLEKPSYTYTGSAIKPKVVKTGSAPADPTYKVSYSSNKSVGTGTVKITGTGNYAGTVTKTFAITRISIAKATVSQPASVIYNGSARAASVTVKVGGKTLKKGTDYDIYYNNSTTAPTLPGTYALKIVGKGNYTDTYAGVQLAFTIATTPITSVSVTLNSSVKYTGAAVTAGALGLKVTADSKELPKSDYTVTYKYPNGTISAAVPSAKGTYTLIITPSGKNVVATSTKPTITKTFTIQ